MAEEQMAAFGLKGIGGFPDLFGEAAGLIDEAAFLLENFAFLRVEVGVLFLKLPEAKKRLGIESFSLLPALKDAEVVFQPIDEIETEQRVDRAADDAGGVLPLGQLLDLLPVEEEEVSDADGKVSLQAFIPVLSEKFIRRSVPVYSQALLDSLGAQPPGALELEASDASLDHAMVLDGNGSALDRVGPAVDALGQVVPVGKVPPVGGLGLAPVEAKLDGVEQCSLASPIHSAEENHGLARSGGENHLLAAGVGAEVVKNDAVDGHGRNSDVQVGGIG
jgi:hypothetical protein